MVRSLWLRALATTLVWTGVAWAQSPSSAPSDKSAEQILTIQEAGKSPQKCKVVKTFRTSDGHQAYQVRALDTGEMMTITEKASSTSTYGAKPQSIATQIYHWGRTQVSPPGVPAPAAEKSTATPFLGAKNPYPSSGAPANAASPPAANAAKTALNTPYSSGKMPTTMAGGAAITQPVPETDWRQSWIKSEEKPLRIDDKLKAKETITIAELAPLRIENKPASKDIAAELRPIKSAERSSTKEVAKPLVKRDEPKAIAAELPPIKSAESSSTKEVAKPLVKRDEKPVAKPTAATSKATLQADDPLLNPDKYMPKVLDVTPRVKVADSPKAHTSAGVEPASKPDQKLLRPIPAVSAPIRIPTLADVAGAGAEPKTKASETAKPKAVAEVSQTTSSSSQLLPALPEAASPKVIATVPAPDKSPVVFDLSKMARPSTGPTEPKTPRPPVVPEMPIATEKSVAGKEIGAPTIPSLPVAPEPVVGPSAPDGHDRSKVASPASNTVGHAQVSSAPVIPPLPLAAAVPPAPLPIAAAVVTSAPPAPMAESRAERPSFLIMDPGAAESSDRAIKLPGVPNAVVAFGQPVTVTAPPPDLVRRKTLEAHTVRVMISQLKESLYPSQRERAAEGLVSANWKVHPQAVEALCTAALQDPAPTVRGRCAESLAAMNVRSQTALAVIHKLQADKDEAVRSRAEEALKILEPAELPQ